MNGWTLSWHGLRVVTGLELRQRIRSRRWVIALIAWFLLIGGVTTLVIWSLDKLHWDNSGYNPGPVAFGINTLFVLGMGLVIAPTFTATSINGDRAAGVLATLQATRLSALEIAAGKLVAAWLTSAVFLVVALPFVIWSMVLGSISFLQVVVCFAVVFALVAVVCAIGLGWSALISRSAGSTVLTYLCVVGLGIISPMVMALSIPFTVENTTVRVWGLPEAVNDQYNADLERYWNDHPDGDGASPPAPPLSQCTWNEQSYDQAHPERVWWMMVPNPFVVVADAAPLPEAAHAGLSSYVAQTGDPLAAIRLGVRTLALGPERERDDCIQMYYSLGYIVDWNDDGSPRVTTEDGTPVPVNSPVKRVTVETGAPSWPWGLGVNLLIGAAFFWVAVNRLRIPYGTLPKGQRVA
ncbi:MAG: ABC transporter permease [Propionicimonas sp.]|uniref:ABC transporter permease n=1 Tax=Propionicimonas sp. TaxID=1955623 RepID=UPI002B2130E9|nr:ABC transporter permease [Propionicimonas sp.]MEA4943235.1 ABC transporter permease [Propionicimonas sp.]MEA5118772.1 ABC transporter permease [Propionicimonas sp.]